jgi:hypothetical protein
MEAAWRTTMPRRDVLTSMNASRRPAAGPVLALLILVLAGLPPGAQAASPLLERVKQNPALARKMCARFKQLNAEGISATSQRSINAVAEAQGLSPMDAEVLITYVIGLNCPDVR